MRRPRMFLRCARTLRLVALGVATTLAVVIAPSPAAARTVVDQSRWSGDIAVGISESFDGCLLSFQILVVGPVLGFDFPFADYQAGRYNFCTGEQDHIIGSGRPTTFGISPNMRTGRLVVNLTLQDLYTFEVIGTLAVDETWTGQGKIETSTYTYPANDGPHQRFTLIHGSGIVRDALTSGTLGSFDVAWMSRSSTLTVTRYTEVLDPE